MWKVLLVEDEAFVRRSIRDLIDWEAEGYTIIGEAGDGEEALELMKMESPDLVLSDIVMPVLDGIDLLRQTRSDGFEGCFVMLTCMNDFEYARQALELGADGYMLKLSMTVQSLGQTLRKMDGVLAQLHQEKLILAQPAIERGYQKVWERYIAQHPSSRIAEELALSVSEAVSAGGLRYVAIASVIQGGGEREVAEGLTTALTNTYGKPSAQHAFSRSAIANVFLWYRDAVISDGEISITTIMGFPAVVSAPVSAEMFPDIWLRALRKLDEVWYEEDSASPVRIQAETDSLASVWPWKLELELVQTFEQREPVKCEMVVDRLEEALLQVKLPLGTVLQAVSRLDGVLEQLAEAATLPVSNLSLCATFGELMVWFRERAGRRLNDLLKSSAKRTDHTAVNQIIDYIHQYYNRDVTLKAMARMVALDEHYLSGLFKKKSGDTLIHYVQRTRIDQAKHLLERTEIPVLEVGERVGFANANYFFKIFKRWTGLTPNDYRRKQFH